MNVEEKSRKMDIKTFLMMQAIVFVYTLTGITEKYASIMYKKFGLISIQVVFFLGLTVLLLGIYAIFWQKVLKRVDLSIAYANKGFGILWSLVYSVLLFKGVITPANVAGIALICLGVWVVNKK